MQNLFTTLGRHCFLSTPFLSFMLTTFYSASLPLFAITFRYFWL
jgi:hypothetical protein